MQEARQKKKYEYERVSETYDGKRYEAYGSTLKEARKKLNNKIAAAKRGEIGISPNMTVESWAETWYKEYLQPKVKKPGEPKSSETMSEKNLRMYEQMLRLYIVPAIGKRRMKDVTEPELKQILNGEKGTSFSHVSKLRIVIKAMFRRAWASRIITYDPSAYLEMPAATKGSRRALTQEEKEVFYRIAATHPHGMLFRFLIATGVRPNEAAAATVGCLDFRKMLVRVDAAVESGTKIIGETKTSIDRFTIMNTAEDPAFVKDLKAYVKEKKADDFIFTQADGKSMVSEQCLKRYWQSFTRAMDIAMGAEMTSRGHIYDPSDVLKSGQPKYPDPEDPSRPRNGHKIAPDLVTYCLRHTFGTNMQRSGVPIDVTKYLMGHRDVATTSNIYVDSGEPEAIRAIEYINDYSARGKNAGKINQSRKKQEKSMHIEQS